MLLQNLGGLYGPFEHIDMHHANHQRKQSLSPKRKTPESSTFRCHGIWTAWSGPEIDPTNLHSSIKFDD